MADSNSDDSKEEQDADTSAAVKEAIMIRAVLTAKSKTWAYLLTTSIMRNCKVSRIYCTKSQSIALSVPLTKSSMYAHAASPPTIVDYQQEVHCLEGEQVSLMVNATGRPTPTISWFFNGRKVEDDYSTELGKDGSLVLVSAEMKHAGTYNFVNNRVGSVEGCTNSSWWSTLRTRSVPVYPKLRVTQSLEKSLGSMCPAFMLTTIW